MVAVLAAVSGIATTGMRVERTRYRPDLWRLPETFVAAAGVLVCGLVVLVARQAPAVAYPAPALLPPLSLTALLVPLAGSCRSSWCRPPRDRPAPSLAPAPAPREEVSTRDQVA